MRKILAIIAGVFLLLPVFAFAQAERSYHYASFEATYTVNTDSTVDVEEKLTYSFNGEYHQGWRSIALKGTDAITDVEVIDADTGQALTYSRSRLDKEKSSSWNKFTTFKDNGAQNVEWYYNLADTPNPTSHTWIIRYKLHGAISFLKNHDELYWNLFTDFDVPVELVTALIHVPVDITAPSAAFYRTNKVAYTSDRPDKSTYRFITHTAAAGEDLTFAVGWQKGVVEKSAFWRDWFQLHWGLPVSLVVFLVSAIYCFIYWRRQEYVNRGRGTIVPEYDPPQNLRPAMADMLMRGSLSSKAWAAEVVDLAVRGYLTILEDKKKEGFFGFLDRSKDYILKTTKKDPVELEDYEKEFLEVLFKDQDTFSTREVKKSATKGQSMYYSLQRIERVLKKEIVSDTRAFAVPPGRYPVPVAIIVFLVVGFCSILLALPAAPVPFVWLIVSLTFSAFLVLFITKYATRLSKEGHILKEKWLGFKMYLETAEKYRMQNLTPELFEKYLSYAMIFGVEKKWAKAFEAMSLPPPQWYAGSSAVYVGGIDGSGGSFSPSGFAGSFSASFSSSFASSGGGGASGGGGGAGGGGGGGGGGAS